MHLIGTYSAKSFLLMGIAIFFSILIANSFIIINTLFKIKESIDDDVPSVNVNPIDVSGGKMNVKLIEVKHI